MSNQQIVKAIMRGLDEHGIHTAVQPAVTTTSVYLTFDGGLLKKARVGDHKGKGYFYTYEIGKHIVKPGEVETTYLGKPYTRFRYGPDQVDELVTQVRLLRSNLRAKYGSEWYARELQSRLDS